MMYTVAVHIMLAMPSATVREGSKYHAVLFAHVGAHDRVGKPVREGIVEWPFGFTSLIV